MVKKGSRRGLNTGNTIRNYRHNPALRQYQKYGCLVVTESTNKSPASNTIMHDIHTRLPSSGPGVELSINKRRRWTMPSQLQQKVYAEHGSENVKITVMEHTMYSPQSVGIEDLLTCDTYCSNRADIPDVVSKSEMTIQQALQGHREEDHLSKLERRAFKKAKRDGQLPIEDTPETDEPEIPMYIFNIAYGAPTDGKLYKELATKGFAKNVGKNKNQVSGCSKKFLKNDQLADFEEGLCYSHQEDEFYEDDDDEVFDDSAQENLRSTRQPQTVNLLDFAKPKANKLNHKKRPLNHSKPVERKSKLYIDKPEMLSKHTKMNNIATTTAYIPKHIEVILKKSEMSAENLIDQFGDYFSEAFSTPRIVTLNLTKELRLRDDQKKFHLVLAHQAEGTETDVYRVYCTGSAVTYAKSKIEDLVDGYSYDLETILSFTLHHAFHNIFKGEPFRISKKASSDLGSDVTPWNVRSSKLADLTEQTISRFKIATVQNKEELFVVNSKAIHQSTSWNQFCGICFEDLNEESPHSALLPCQHYFCNHCWSIHITSAIRAGTVSITCPEYECNKPVDPVFVMAMVEYRNYASYENQLTEFSYFSKKKANWCPTDRCGRMYYCGDELADTDDPISVSCLCGKECCFKCLNEPHWPLSCSQLLEYHRSLENVRGRHGFLAIETLKLPVQVARTKICPWCSYPIEKYGGCDTMTCGRCLKPFCWKCGEKFDRAHYEAAFCTEQMAKRTMYKDEIKVPNSGNRDLDEACRHRLYKSPYMKKQIDESTTRLIFNTGFKAAQCFLSMSLHDSFDRYLRQVQRQLLASHRLLEYCSAVNYFRPGSRICISRISTLDFSLTVLEEIIKAKKCDEKTIERLVKFYELAKSNTDSLMSEISAALNYVKPALHS